MQVNSNQLNHYVTQLHTALDSSVFNPNMTEDDSWKPEFAKLFTLLHDVLTLADQTGKRIDFLEEVGVNGKIQEITSSINWMHDRLPELTSVRPNQLATNHFN